MNDSNALLKAYKEDSDHARIKSLDSAYLVAIVLMSTGYFMDLFIYYDHFKWLVGLRTLCIIILILFFSYQYIKKTYFPSILEHLFITTIIITLSAMIFITDGVESTYFSALSLGLILISILLTLDIYHYISIFILVINIES